MFILKLVARRTNTALIVTDHLPLGNEDAWQKGNGAKAGNAGFMYRVTAGKQDQVSIDCGKARGAPKAKSYVGVVASESYGTDRKGRMTTVNVFKRQIVMTQQQHEQSAVMKLAAMLPGVTGGDMNALRAGHMVTFDSVAEIIGDKIKENDRPGYVVNKDAASKMFEKIALTALLNSGLFRTVPGTPYLIVYAPAGSVRQELVMPWTFTIPVREVMPWQ